MNNLELSRKIRDHLTQQKAQALGTENGVISGMQSPCRYRGDDGTMCAVGCLIPDDHYSEYLEGMGVDVPVYQSDNRNPVNEVLIQLYGSSVDLEMLRSWQRYHDSASGSAFYADWCADKPCARSPAEVHFQLYPSDYDHVPAS